jgi:ABC-type iron transport system FetAB ATPase subunit
MCTTTQMTPTSNGHPVAGSTSERLVLTKTTQRQLHDIALAVSVGLPVLLQGPTGAGKTSLIEELASLTGRKQGKLIYKLLEQTFD